MKRLPLQEILITFNPKKVNNVIGDRVAKYTPVHVYNKKVDIYFRHLVPSNLNCVDYLWQSL